jgi:hypothetical protein
MTYMLSGGAPPTTGAGAGPSSSAGSFSSGGFPGAAAPGGAGGGTPHHISNEPLCELSLCICLARRLPVAVLTRAVRATYVPGEYPGSIAALYAGTPDEAPPQFYTDPGVFRSMHHDMADLGVSDWAGGSAEEFVRIHR